MSKNTRDNKQETGKNSSKHRKPRHKRNVQEPLPQPKDYEEIEY